MSTQAAGRHIAGWLTDLAVMSAGNAPLADAKVKVAALSRALAEGYPAAVFCPKSLLEVARQCKFFPAYSELCEHLDAWWKDHKPAQPELPPPPDTWSERVKREHDEAMASWETITATEVRARIAGVQAMPPGALQHACGLLLARAIGKHAAHHLGLLPPAWLGGAPTTGGTDTAAVVRPRHLTPEQLQTEKGRLQRERVPA